MGFHVCLADGGNKYGTFTLSIFLDYMKEIDPAKKKGIVVFYEASNAQMRVTVMKAYYPIFTVMCGV